MTEVRPVPYGGGLGVFATRDYDVGDDVLVESNPLVDLSSLTSQQEEELLSNLNLLVPVDGSTSSSSSFRDAVVVPGDVHAAQRGTFRSLARVGAWFVVFRPSTTTLGDLLELYSPSTTHPSDDELGLVRLAQRALQYLKDNSRKGSTLNESLAQDAGGDLNRQVLTMMLVWACNAFDGGRIYKLQSRVNHSCRPNAVVHVKDASSASQTIRAATSVAAGEEVRISYLGTLLFGDILLRTDELRHSKCFTCQCERCDATTNTSSSGTPDVAASVPCVVCHPRSHRKRQLDEDAQYDDDQTVKYMVPSCRQPKEEDSSSSSWVWTCEACHESIPERGNKEYAPAFEACRSVSRTVASYLRERSSSEVGGAATSGDGDNNDADSAILEEHLTLASSVVGARHWTTNLLLLLQLDQMLQEFNSRVLRSDVDAAQDASDGDDMDTLAAMIDMLERIYRFADGLNLPIHSGHLLSHVTIGVARALVSLGDAKSCAYAREWLEKLDGYTEHFESEGIQKVVTTLKGRAPQAGQDADERQTKKHKAR